MLFVQIGLTLITIEHELSDKTRQNFVTTSTFHLLPNSMYHRTYTCRDITGEIRPAYPSESPDVTVLPLLGLYFVTNVSFLL